MKKGLIMELKRDYAIVLNDDGTMEKILIKPQMAVGQKIFYFDEDIVNITETTSLNRGKFKYSTFMKSFGSIAALFLLVFTFFYNMNISKTVAIVSLDINPSIQIEVDNNQNIIKVIGMNDDGKNIDFSQVKGCNINDGIKVIKDILVEKEYLKNNKDVLVGFAFVKNGEQPTYEDEIKEAVLTNFDTENVTYLKAEDKKDVEVAKEQGISLGRYEASKVVDENTKKKIVDAPVKEITEQIKDKENVSYYNATEEAVKDTSAPKDENKNPVQVDEPSEKVNDTSKNSNNKNNSNDIINNSDSKTEENVSNKQPDISAPVDENITNKSDNNDTDTKKPEINNGILELEPEKPENTETDKNQGGEGSVIIDPDKNVIENNTTSGKIEEDKDNNIENDTDGMTIEQLENQKVK